MQWTDFLTEAEFAELHRMDLERIELIKQRRRIYDRCRKRMARKVAAQ